MLGESVRWRNGAWGMMGKGRVEGDDGFGMVWECGSEGAAIVR